MTRSRDGKLLVLVLGAVGLAGALTVAAIAAPTRAARAAVPYTPAEPTGIVAHVPPREPAEVAARAALAASPDDVELAVELARADVARYRKLADPRYLGRAQATLARWWTAVEPPTEVLLLRATIAQATHAFAAARADLDRLIAREPAHVQAHLTRAVVATVTADYAAARASCTALHDRVPAVVVAACEAPLDGLAGRAEAAYARLAAAPRGNDPAVRGWALTALAELAIQLGRFEDARAHLREALVVDADDSYARNLLADVLLATDREVEASALLAGRDAIDSHLVRRAIAEHAAGGSDAARLVGAMRERISAAAARGDRIHLREEAMFALAVDDNAPLAVALARDNWEVQKELADARLLAAAAAAAGDLDAAAAVRMWARTTGVRDVWLDRALARLEVP